MAEPVGAALILWRGDLPPLGCAAALKQLTQSSWHTALPGLGAAAQPNGDKSPRHKSFQASPSPQNHRSAVWGIRPGCYRSCNASARALIMGLSR
ncbi:hypothetical protein C0J56_01335 [Pseudomonas fluorescens]|nr:hypothetical protein C0J56_01335 [Pseudomonas fluorescens]